MTSADMLSAVTPADGRYAAQTQDLRRHFSEGALIRHRILIELAWLETLVPLLAPERATPAMKSALAALRAEAEDPAAAEAVKALEKETRHDVKAVEYWLRERLAAHQQDALSPYIHFACTSWDINNIALALQVSGALQEVMMPALREAAAGIRKRALDYADIPMLARTHGQPASPTTLGKEFANFAHRLAPRLTRLDNTRLPAKFSGAVGNYNAHVIARADIDWPQIARAFVEQHSLKFAACTTQIEPYDDLADLFDLLRRVNTILLDFCRDCWGYISLEYFMQQSGGGREAGSSTMPHKINPIDFENAEGNLGIANALFAHFADKLPVSRWQRDLSDSTVLRAIGSAFAHTLIAWRAIDAGLNKLQVNRARLQADLDNNRAVLTEAVQTVLRAEGVTDAYEQLKTLSRGQALGADALHDFIRGLPIGAAAKERLLALTPASYCGLAAKLAREAA